MSAPRRLLVAALALMLFAIAGKLAFGDALGGVPWPRHIEWTRYEVGENWVICKPDEADSTGVGKVCMPLPEGAEVYVPRWVTGRDPDGGRTGIDTKN